MPSRRPGADDDRLADAGDDVPGSAGNPLVGIDGRVALLRRLGEALHDQPQLFGLDVVPA